MMPSENMLPGTFGQRIVAIDMFRGLAALAIVLVHVAYLPPGWQEASPMQYAVGVVLMPFSQMALAMFILMSGYCIHANTLRASPSDQFRCDWGRFWKRRFFRLYPPYIVVVLLCSVLTVFLFMHEGIPWKEALVGTAKDTAAHTVMVHNLMPNYATGLFNGTLWTLATEEQMYLMYIPFLWLRRRSLGLALTAAVAVSIVGWQGWIAFAPERLGEGSFHLGCWLWWPFQFWFYWVLGTVVAEAHASRLRLWAWCKNVRLACFMVLLSLLPHPWIWQPLTGTKGMNIWLVETLSLSSDWVPYLAWVCEMCFFPWRPLAFMIFLHACIRYERRPQALSSRFCRVAAYLGMFSYSLYLIHMPVLVLFHKFWTDEPLWLRFVLNVPLCVGLAWVFFRVVEERFLRAGKTPSRMTLPQPQSTATRKMAA